MRIGLLLDTTMLSRFFAEVIDHIQRSDFARLELLVFNSDAQQKSSQPPPWPKPLYRKVIDLLGDRPRRERILFRLYERWDQRSVVSSIDPLVSVDCSPRLEQIDSIVVTPITKKFVHRFPPETIAQIRDRQLDVLIRFGFNILRGEILNAARYGVWSYHHGDNDYYRGGPAYFWEVYEANPLSGVILQILTEELDAGKILYKGIFATEPGFSRARNCVQPYWGSASFMIQKLHDLHEHGWERLERSLATGKPYMGRKKIYTAPTNLEMVKWLGPLLIRKTANRLVRLRTIAHWRLAVRRGARTLDSCPLPDLDDFRWVESPVGRFYADPFLVEESGKQWLFFEDFDYARQLGRISCAQVLEEGGLSTPMPALETPYHISYPCIFRDGDTWFMIPESAANDSVDLYRCTRFPDQWRKERNLFKAHMVDTTVWIEDGLYWFFTTVKEPRGHGAQLWIFYAKDANLEWMPHPANPISTDIRYSRGAGAIFRCQGKLIRPSQDCSRNYGRSFTLNQILVLNPDEYKEAPHLTVEPKWANELIGMHTYSHAGDIEIIDGCARLPAGRVLALN